MSFHRVCCCGPQPPQPGCADFATCDACGELKWAVSGTLIKEIYGAGGSPLVQRQTWVITSLDIETVNRSVSGPCRWLNNFAQSGSNADFLSYSGTYILEVGSSTLVSTFSFTEPSANLDWQTDSVCDQATFVETLTMRLSRTGGLPTPYIAQDQNGDDIDVTPPVMTFARDAFRDCPIGTFNMVDPGGLNTEWPSLPLMESTEV